MTKAGSGSDGSGCNLAAGGVWSVRGEREFSSSGVILQSSSIVRSMTGTASSFRLSGLCAMLLHLGFVATR